MKKRAVSLLLALAMIAALIPASLAAEGVVYEYNFTSAAVGKSGSFKIHENFGITFEDNVSSVSAPWYLNGARAYNNGQIETNLTYWNAKMSNASFNAMDVVFKLRVDEGGTYTPTFNYTALPGGYKVKLYLSKAEADDPDMSALTNSANIKDYVLSHSSDVIGEVDMYAESEEEKSVSFGEVTLSAGEYNLIFVSNGTNESFVPLLENYIEAKINSLVLDGTNPKSLKVESSAGSTLEIGGTSELSAEIIYGSGKAYKADNLEFESLDEAVLSVSGAGVVTALSAGDASVRVKYKGTAITKDFNFTVKAAAVKNTYDYVFSLEALNASADVTINDLKALGLSDVDGKVSAPWRLVGFRGVNNIRVQQSTNAMYLNGYTTTTFNFNTLDFALEIAVGADGTYTPSMSFTELPSGYIIAPYIARVDESGSYDMTTSTGIRDFVVGGVSKKLGEVDMFSDKNRNRGVAFEPVALTKGNYYVVFALIGVNDKHAPMVIGTKKYAEGIIKSFSLDAKDVESFSASAAASKLQLDETAEITPKAKYASGKSLELLSGITYESLNKDIISVNSKGLVTALAEGEGSVRVRLDGTELYEDIAFTVEGADSGNAGVVLTYKTNTNSMLDQTVYGRPRLDASGVLRDFADIDSFEKINPLKSSLWAFSKYTNYNANMDRTYINGSVRVSSYASHPMFGIKIKVTNKGMYNFYLNPYNIRYGTAADIYIVPVGDSAQASYALTQTAEAQKVGSYDFAESGASKATSGGEVKLGKVNIPSRGDYYVIFVFDSANTELLSGLYHSFYIAGMSLKACAGEFESAGISVDGIAEEGDPMPLGTVKKASVKLLDAAGAVLEDDEIDRDKLSVVWSSSAEDVAYVSEDGMIEARKNGTAEIKASVTYDGKTDEAKYSLLVAPMGKNLFADRNSGFETDEWNWNATRRDALDESLFMSVGIGVCEKDGNSSNRAMAVRFNPLVAAVKNPPEIVLNEKANKRIEIKPNNVYQLTFKMKIDYKNAPSASDLQLIFDTYGYSNPTGRTSADVTGDMTRSYQIELTPNYRELYKDWYEVTLPICAPLNASSETMYVTPRLVFRPNASDLSKAGYEGTVWFDDFELREVGFVGLEVEKVSGVTNMLGQKPLEIAVRPISSTGKYISLDSSCLPDCVTFESSDPYVVKPAENSVRTETMKGSGIFYALAKAALGGKNGTTNMTATMELNGVKASGSCEISTSDLPIDLLYGEASFEKGEINVGEKTKIIPVGYYSDGNTVDLSQCEVVYKSNDVSVLEVDEATGEAKGVRAGKTTATAMIKLGNIVVEADCEITVRDDSAIASATLAAPETVGYLRDEKLVVSGVMESGYKANIADAEVTYECTSEPTGGVTVTADGRVYGETFGAVGTITAHVRLNGKTVDSNPVTVTVVESDLRSFTIDFRKHSTNKPLKITLDTDGWEIDLEKSNASVKNSSFTTYGLTAPVGAENRNLVVKFTVPYTGNYKITYTGHTMNWGAELSNFYIDDLYVGEYCHYSNNSDGEVRDMRTVYMTAGTHYLTISPRALKTVSRSYYLYPKEISFAAREALPTVSEIRTSAERYELRVGDSAALTSEMRLSDGFWYDVRNMYDTSKSKISEKADPNASITYTSGNTSVVTIDSDGKIKATGAGDTVITVTATSDGSTLEKEIPVSVDGSGIETATIKGDRRTFYVGESFVLEPKVILASGAELSEENITGVTWSTDNAAIASVSGSTLVAVAEGETVLRGTAAYNGITRDIEETITVEADSFGAVEIEADTLVMRPNSEGVTLSVKAKTHLGKDVSMSGAEISFESDNEDVAAVSDDGHVTPAAVGMADITVSVTIDGVTVSKTVTVSVRTGKVSGTIYTEEMVNAARENARKYTWAASTKNSYEKACEQYLSKSMDELWEMIPGEGIPRANHVGYRNDPDTYVCRHPDCRANLFSLYGSYPWVCKPASRPWKIQCPECKRIFPTNDFEGLYKMTIAANNGIYDVELAHKLNAESVANGGKDYLHNDIYPELGATWGVDDGMGYDTGNVYPNGVKEVHTYIAYYNHYGLWYKSKDNNPGYVTEAIKNLAHAYMYTGDKKYGRLGAIMLDRVADLYPGFDLTPYLPTYANSDGSSSRGKILGRIWETFLAEDFSRCYDALFPMFDDEQVIDFLSIKAHKYPNDEHLMGKLDENGKVTPESLRENCETGILREVYKSVCNSQTAGNFGMHQGALAAAAVALDSGEETNEMIDWIFNNGEMTNQSNTGGNVSERLIKQVSRDGQGNESAPGYNRLWIDAMTNLANLLGPYEGYDGMDMYSNPKYVAMVSSYAPLTLVRRGLPNIGDSGVYGMYTKLPDNTDVLLDSYRFLKDSQPEIAREIAQHLYFVKDGNLDDVHYGIFVNDPESIRNEVRDIIAEYGEYDYDKSRLLSGYGIASLRSGTLHESVGANVLKDTQRGFWSYFGGSVSHNNQDKLSLGIEAYGIGMTSDLGYPEATGANPNRHQWQKATIAHNTVMVNEEEQIVGAEPHDPTHFDSKDGKVKVMEIDGKKTYAVTDEYDRTVVMVDYDSDVSYGIDFFKVRGGNDHLYSFHPSSEEDPESSLSFKAQLGGTYAGASVPFGEDPYTDAANQYTVLKYPKGYTWLENIRKNEDPKTGNFWVDYKIKDIGKFSRNSNLNVRMRITMLNDFTPSEVTLATGMPPRTKTNLANIKHIQYLLVRRKGENLNTLFTTVYEPYSGSRYVKSMESVPVTLVSGSPKSTDAVKAVKVELVNGRTDYIVYAQDNTATYDVGGVFEFCGFVGVYSINENGDNIYSYVNDGEKIGENDGLDASIGGSVKGFTKDLVFDNSIDVEFDTDGVNPEDLIDRTIHIENDGVRNAVYTVKNAVMTGERTARIDVGNITFIRAYKDKDNADLGYVYDIAENQRFEIPMSYEFSGAPVFDEIKEVTATADSSITLHVKARSDDDAEITYKARRLPTGASFNGETGEFNWKPTSSQIGENIVGIDAIDSEGRVSTVYFTITVYGSTTQNGGGGAGGGGGGGTPAPTPEPEPTPTPDPEPTPNPEPTPDPTPGDNDGGFVDIDNYAWAKDSINALANAGIIRGTSEDTFSPSSNITRADFAILLVRAFKLTGEGKENFADVDASDYFAHELAIAKENGIVGGIGDNKYAPRNTITREDMMVIVYRALTALGMIDETNAERNDTQVVPYEDFDSVADYAKDAVSYLIANGLVNGKNGLIDPKAYTTRAEVAVLVKRILDFTADLTKE